ncbi:MAG: hypothetical protein JNM17_17120 [Archangium sp.]|nr:hypothetical protein [Archangium sp.]
MTVRRTGSRTPVSTGCGASSTRGTSKPSPRKPVSTGCGTPSTGGWTPKPKVSTRSKELLEKAKGKDKTEKRTVSTGCGTSKPSTPSKPSKPTRTGC